MFLGRLGKFNVWIFPGECLLIPIQGGSLNIMDLDNKLTISYVMNKMSAGTVGNPRTVAYVNCVYDCLKKLQDSS